jgi:hypothetical protein
MTEALNSQGVGQVAVAVELDSRPVVTYRPMGNTAIEVGYRTFIIPLNHYSVGWVENGYPATTTTVLAHDAATGAFETKNTRYVLEKPTVH